MSSKPTPKVLYVEIDDEITSLIDRLKKLSQAEVLIVVPDRANLIQSIVNLKILNKEARKLNKNISLVTTDKKGRNLASSIGFAVFEKVTDKKDEDIPIKAALDIEPDEIALSPLQAVKNKLLEFQPIVKKSKKSLKEIINKVRKEKAIKFPQKLSKKEQITFNSQSHREVFVGGFLVIAILLLIFIIRIALPSATLFIKPKVKQLSYATNIFFVDQTQKQKDLDELNQNLINSTPISMVLEKTGSYPATGEIYEGTKAHGEITIYNNAPATKYLVPSRFQNKDGLIFWSKTAVTVPAKKGDTPGEITVQAEADDYDINGKLIGNRGNIDPSDFVLPAIPNLSPSLYYGRSKKPMVGGDIKVIKQVLAADIEVAKNKVVEELYKNIKEKLDDYLKERNGKNNTDLVFLDVPAALNYEVLDLQAPENIIGTRQDYVEVKAKMQIYAFVYSRGELERMLEQEIVDRVHPDMKLAKIDYGTTQIRVIEKDFKLGRIKCALSLDSATVYDFDTKTETGRRLQQKLKEKILGKSVKEAREILNNSEEIYEVEIHTWPLWTRSLPGVPGNIKIKIRN